MRLGDNVGHHRTSSAEMDPQVCAAEGILQRCTVTLLVYVLSCQPFGLAANVLTLGLVLASWPVSINAVAWKS